MRSLSQMGVLLWLMLVFSGGWGAGQEAGRPEEFKALEAHLDRQGRVWDINNRAVAKAFNEDRKRLGKSFEKALSAYLGEDLNKHYWISNYLTEESYLHGNAAMPHLALLIKQQGLVLCGKRQDDNTKAQEVALLFTAAVLSEKLGLRVLAGEYKTRVTGLLRERPILAGGTPAMSEAEWKLYELIPVDAAE